MSTFETELERQLDDLAREVDPSGPERVLLGVRRTHRNRRLAKAAAFTAGIAVAAGAVIGLNTAGVIGEDDAGTTTVQAGSPKGDSATSGVRQPDGVFRPKEPGEPCDGARHARSPEELQRQTNVPVWTPASGRFTDAWTCGQTPVLLYEGIQISYQQGWENVDVDVKWRHMVDTRGGRIETILGRPAYVHPADDNGPRNGVLVVVDGTAIVTVSRPGVPVEKLVELTNSIELPPGLRR